MAIEAATTLEIIREGDFLKMSISERRDLSPTLRHYSKHRVDFAEIDKLCHEVILLLNKTGHSGPAFLKSLEKTALALWDHLFTRSVKEKLRQSSDSTLILEIDEELIFIPWELLYDGNNFLALKFNLGRLVRTQSKSMPPDYRSLGHTLKMLVLANPTNDLKASYLEGLSIRNQLDRKRRVIRVDFKSTDIDRLYIKKNICDYDIVHFAGHCEYGYHNTSESGWVLSDGNFSIQDILKLGSGVSLPALIFSNACHSAPLLKEGLVESDYQKKNYSLAGAFLFSGVRHYIGSIRKIEDTASLTFAKELYQNLVLGSSLGAGLRLARLKLAKEYGISSMHWANYLLYGDPGFTLLKPIAPDSTKKIVFPKKWFKRLIFLLPLAAILIYLYFLLPTFNPNAYFLFLKSKSSFAKGRNQEVLTLGKRIIAKDRNFIGIYPLIADTYHKIGENKSAIKYYFDYLFLAQKLRDNKHLLSAYIAIGWFYHLDGDYKKAREFYDKALSLSIKVNDKLNEAIALRKLAVWNIDQNSYDKALVLLTKSSEINRQHQNLAAHRYNLACDYFDIGLVFSNKDDYATAEEFYRKSKSIFEQVKLNNEMSDYYFNLGELYLFEKQYENALSHYLAGLKIDKSQGNKKNLASDYNMIGELYMDIDRFVDAEENFNLALTVSEEIKSRTDIAQAYYNLGILYQRLEKKAKAKDYLRKAQEIYGVIDPLAYQEVKKEILSMN